MAMGQLGLYRGVVRGGFDPDARSRVQVVVPDVSDSAVWAEACSPITPWLIDSMPPLPETGTEVWVMFERGDSSFPVVVGSIRGPSLANPPPPGALSQLRFPGGEVAIDARDPLGSTVAIRLTTGAGVTLSARGLVLDNGQGASIAMEGPAVNINRGALEIV